MDHLKKRKLDENGETQSNSSEYIAKLTQEDARKLIETFNQDQLLNILQTAVIQHSDVLDAVRSIADLDVTQRKLFIRGLGWDTTTEKLRALFSGYGELEEAIVILDKVTGKSKGFGFVTYKHVDGALLALKEPSKKIDGRMTITQLAITGTNGPVANAVPPTPVDVSLRKVYVATVPFDMPADRLLAHFATFGEIEEGPLGFDKVTGKSKGYALFIYKTAEAAQAAVLEPAKIVDGRPMICKLAIDGKKNKPVVQTMQPTPVGIQMATGNPGGGAAVNGQGMQLSVMPGSMPSQYGAPGGLVGISAYGGFSGGPQAHQALAHHHRMQSLPSGVGGPGGLPSAGGYPSGVSSAISQVQSPSVGSGGYGIGMSGGSYGGLHHGAPGLSGYGGLGGAGSGFGGTSLYSRFPPSSVGMPTGGGQLESAHYSLSSSSSFPGHLQAGTTPAQRNNMYSGVPPYR